MDWFATDAAQINRSQLRLVTGRSGRRRCGRVARVDTRVVFHHEPVPVDTFVNVRRDYRSVLRIAAGYGNHFVEHVHREIAALPRGFDVEFEMSRPVAREDLAPAFGNRIASAQARTERMDANHLFVRRPQGHDRAEVAARERGVECALRVCRAFRWHHGCNRGLGEPDAAERGFDFGLVVVG